MVARTKTAALHDRGDVVTVEGGPWPRPWRGVVQTVKWSPLSGWWIEVRELDSSRTWALVEALARKG